MDNHSIGKTIAELRRAKGWTQSELAKKLDISDKTVSKWENESGNPDLAIFPEIAKIFDVTVDYLMTGKTIEPKIITISKAELCAKNDDISLLEDIDFAQKDENNKCIIDYISQYESLNVFVELCSKNKKALSSFDIITAIRFCLISNNLEILNNVSFKLNRSSFEFTSPYDIMRLLPAEDKKSFNGTIYSDLCILPNDLFETVVTDKRINNSTINFLLGKQQNRECVWYHVFPYLIDVCYKNNNTHLLEMLISLSEENNQYAYENYKDRTSYTYSYFFINARNNKGHGVVRILAKTLDEAFARNDFELVERFNTINKNIMNYSPGFKCKIISDDELRIARLKLDKSVSEDEILVQSSIHYGIIYIDELLKVSDLKLIENALNTYPISKFEQEYATYLNLQQTFDKDNWRTIFEYAVDHNDDTLAQYLINGQKSQIESWLGNKQNLNKQFAYSGSSISSFIAQNEPLNPNKKYLKLRNNKNRSLPITLTSINDYIFLCKKQIVDDLKISRSTDSIVAELNEEFFRTELNKGNKELVAIKLCVRMEAVLKSKYHYEGDFSEMLEKYCSKYGTHEQDDGWGYNEWITEKFVPYLQKLRRYRNSIVHSEKNVSDMTNSELEFCIQYICGIK